MKFFNNCNCAEELKSLYLKLVVLHHPDKGGNLETMQAINAEYDKCFKVLKDVHKNTKADVEGNYYTATKSSEEIPEEFRAVIYTCMGLSGLEVELVGRWIWISGDTKEHKEALKTLGCKWCKNKSCWSWHTQADSVVSKGKKNMNEIREAYGSVKFSNAPTMLLG